MRQETIAAAEIGLARPFAFDTIERFGDSVALIDEEGGRVTYAELVARADRLAAGLGADPRLVLVEAANDLSTVVALVACLRGRHPVMVGSELSSARLETAFAPAFVLARGDVREVGAGVTPLHPDLAVMLSTSGSTGATKLVRLSREAVGANAASIVEYLAIDPGERAVTTLPISYSYGLSVLTSHLSVGASVILTDRSVVDDDLWRLIRTFEATSIAGVPYTYELLEATNFRDRPPGSLRTLTQAGGRLRPDLAASYADWARANDVRFFMMYGQTEATARMAYMPPELIGDYPGAIGKAVPGGELRVVDDAGNRVAPGVTGELVYAGANVMMGYAETAADLARGAELDELHTGDLGEEIADGVFRVVGRRSRFSKIAGLRIDLDEIERLLAAAGITGIVAGDDEMVAIGVVDGADLVAAERLVDQKTSIPSRSRVVFALGEIPRLISGKVDFARVRAAGKLAFDAAESEAQSLEEAVGNDRLATLFARALKLPSVKDEDSFVSLHGDSLSYIEVSMIVERELGYLPGQWERLSIGHIKMLVPSEQRSPAGLFAWRSVSSEIVLRALAIVMIVLHHTFPSEDLGGGLDVLLVLIGVNLARFQTELLASSSRWRIVAGVLYRLVLPYYLIMAVYSLRPMLRVGWPDILLISNLFGRFHSFWEPYWFVEGYVQALIIIVALASVPAIGRMIGKNPARFGVGFLIASLAVKVGAMAAIGHYELMSRTPDQFLYIVAIGWCIHEARTARARAALALVTLGLIVVEKSGLAVWSAFGGYWHCLALGATTIVLLYVPLVKLPNVVRRPLTMVAVSGLVIYLTHTLLLRFAGHWLSGPRERHLSSYLTAALVIAVGVALYHLLSFVLDRVSRRRAGGHVPAASF